MLLPNSSKKTHRRLEFKDTSPLKSKQAQGQRQHFHQQKSLKQLILSKPKYSLIEKIQVQLSALCGVRVIERTIFYLAWYISHYQTLYQLIYDGMQNTNATFNRLKNYSTSTQKEGTPFKSKPKHEIPKFPVFSERNSPEKKEIKVFMDSYKFKCLKEFFAIDSYAEESLITTVVQKLHQKIKKEEIRTMDSRLPSIRRISIVQHRLQLHEMNKHKQSNSPKKIQLNPAPVLQKLMRYSTPVETTISFHNKIEPKKTIKKVNCIAEDDFRETKNQPTNQRSFKSENRRNGIHDLNKILVEIEQLKQILSQNYNQGQEVINRASSLKSRLNNLLCNLTVKSTAKNSEIKGRDLNFNKLR